MHSSTCFTSYVDIWRLLHNPINKPGKFRQHVSLVMMTFQANYIIQWTNLAKFRWLCWHFTLSKQSNKQTLHSSIFFTCYFDICLLLPNPINEPCNVQHVDIRRLLHNPILSLLCSTNYVDITAIKLPCTFQHVL